MEVERRRIIALGIGLIAGAGPLGSAALAAGSHEHEPKGARELLALSERLANAPRRRDFKTVPMILDHSDLWDHEALSEVLAYKGQSKQVWDNTEIGGPWLNLMRNSLNNQVWSFKHPDFLAVSATHSSAHFALYDQTTWDKYQLAKLAGEQVQDELAHRAAEGGRGRSEELPRPGRRVLSREQHDSRIAGARCRVSVLPQRNLGAGRGSHKGGQQP